MKILLTSLHGLFRGRAPEIGRDADNGGQIVYPMELAQALARRSDIESVTLLTRLIDDPALSPNYAQPVEQAGPKFRIRRIGFLTRRARLQELLQFAPAQRMAAVNMAVRFIGSKKRFGIISTNSSKRPKP